MLSSWGNAVGIKPQRAKWANKNCIIDQPSSRKSALFLHYILKHHIVKASFILWLQPLHSHTAAELSWTRWRNSSKSKHITAVCPARGLSKWGTNSTHSRESPPITNHNTGKRTLFENGPVRAVWKHLYWTQWKAEVLFFTEVFKYLAYFVPLTSSSSPQGSRRFAESFSHSLPMIDRRLALEE